MPDVDPFFLDILMGRNGILMLWVAEMAAMFEEAEIHLDPIRVMFPQVGRGSENCEHQTKCPVAEDVTECRGGREVVVCVELPIYEQWGSAC